MLNMFVVWLSANWDLLVEIFIWTLTILMVLVLAAKIYKIIKFRFEAMDTVGLFFGGLWIFAIIIFGFDHIRQFLQNLL
jgi:hypothetical protein